jgi:hypothetical protein
MHALAPRCRNEVKSGYLRASLLYKLLRRETLNSPRVSEVSVVLVACFGGFAGCTDPIRSQDLGSDGCIRQHGLKYVVVEYRLIDVVCMMPRCTAYAVQDEHRSGKKQPMYTGYLFGGTSADEGYVGNKLLLSSTLDMFGDPVARGRAHVWEGKRGSLGVEDCKNDAIILCNSAPRKKNATIRTIFVSR